LYIGSHFVKHATRQRIYGVSDAMRIVAMSFLFESSIDRDKFKRKYRETKTLNVGLVLR